MPSRENAASTGAPRLTPGWPLMPNVDSVTESGMVPTRCPSLAYTVMLWRYIMFCANTMPCPLDATDFGEMAPLMVATLVSRPRSECRAAAPWWSAGATACDGRSRLLVVGRGRRRGVAARRVRGRWVDWRRL